MKINIKVTLVVLGMSLLIGCNRKIAPTIIIRIRLLPKQTPLR